MSTSVSKVRVAVSSSWAVRATLPAKTRPGFSRTLVGASMPTVMPLA
jgi:hypothetical protein